MRGIAITDSTCLIALERIERLNLLSSSFNRILIPPQVNVEFGVELGWLQIQEVKDTNLLKVLRLRLDDGEASAIALAMECPGAILILDDLKARKIAITMGLNITGTIGLILQCKRKGIIKLVRPILNELQSVGFNISDALFQKALILAKEK